VRLWLVSRSQSNSHLHSQEISLVYLQRFPLPFVALQKFGIVVSFTVHPIPREDCVIARRQASQREVSTLIADGFAIALRSAAKARFGYGDNHRVVDGFILFICGYALGGRSIGAGQ